MSKSRVLMGRRAAAHAFMPNLYVFPGGRRDAGDHRLPFSDDLDPRVMEKLLAGPRRAIGTTGARALALAAVRELEEETSLRFNGAASDTGAGPHLPSLASLRFVARAITPPGHPRRFDTRFFLAFTDEVGIDPSSIRNSSELGDLQWVDMNAVSGLNMPDITTAILGDVIDMMKVDPSLTFGGDVPFYLPRRGLLARQML